MAESVMRIAGERSKPMPRKVGFTIATLNAATCPAGKTRAIIYDQKTPGLALRITSNRAKTFVVCIRVNGKYERIKLGSFPTITIEQARKLAKVASGEIAKGGDPIETKRQARTRSMTIAKLWEWFLETHAKPRKRSWRDDEVRYEKHIAPSLAHRPIEKLTRSDVAALHRRLAQDHAPATANRVVALLSVMYNKAREIDYKGGNPCEGVERFRETSRDRFLSADELPRFMSAIEDEQTPEMWRHYFTLLLLTGARSGNLKSMRWSEVDLSSGTWRIPQEKAKAGETILVHLSTSAISILETRQQAVKGPWVFPAAGSKSGHVVEPRKQWENLLRRAKLPGVRIHDLRRTLGSWQAATGASLSVIGKSLGHRNVATTAIYARLNIDPVRESVNKATDAMLAAVEAKKV